MASASIKGRFVWHELMTSDTKAGAAFFAKLIGWKTQSWPQNPDYTLLMTGGRSMAGVMAVPDDAKKMGTPPSWVTYVGTPSVDDSAKQAVSLGGKILKQPTDIPTIGRFAVIQDPQGAVFSLFTPGAQAPQDGGAAPGVGDFSWHELATTDWKAAFAFYQKMFGWEATSSMDMGPELGTYQMYGWPGQPPLGGMFNKPKNQPGPPSWLPYIKVRDAKSVAASVAKLGGKVVNGPMEVPGGDWIAQGIDPQGAMFAVHSAKTTPTAKKPPRKAKKAAKKPARKKSAKKPARKAKKTAKKSRRR